MLPSLQRVSPCRGGISKIERRCFDLSQLSPLPVEGIHAAMDKKNAALPMIRLPAPQPPPPRASKYISTEVNKNLKANKMLAHS